MVKIIAILFFISCVLLKIELLENFWQNPNLHDFIYCFVKDQGIRRRGHTKIQPVTSSIHISPTLYLREELLSLRAEFPDPVISYDPFNLATKLNNTQVHFQGHSGPSFSNIAKSSFGKLFAFLNSPSPILLAYCQYKSAGYPWSIACVPPSLIAILAIRWLEVSPTTPTGNENLILLTETGNSELETAEVPSIPGSPVASSDASNVSRVDIRRWPLTFVDPYPQWRVLCAYSDQFIAIGYSNGAIEVIGICDAIGDNASRIFIQSQTPGDTFAPIVGLDFIQDASHLAVCRFFGEIELWRLQTKTSGFSARLVVHTLHDSPIFSVVYDPSSKFLVIGAGSSGTLSLYSVDTKTVSPHSHQPVGSPPGTPSAASPKIRSLIRSLTGREDTDLCDSFASISLSPRGNLLAALHCSRAISLWSFPGCALLSKIISDAVPLTPSFTAPCNPLSLSHKSSIPLHLGWWSNRSTSDSDPADLLAVLKSDGVLSVIDVDTMESQLLSADSGDAKSSDGGIQFYPFAVFARLCDPKKTELIILNCSAVELHNKDHTRRIGRNQAASASSSWFSVVAAALGFTSDSAMFPVPTVEIGPLPLIIVNVNVVRMAATSPRELFIHRLRSCRFAEALALTEGDQLDIEVVWQHQWLALFRFPLEPTKFEKMASICLANIVTQSGWLVRECLQSFPPTDERWRPMDLLRVVEFILNAGLARCKDDPELANDFRERLGHVEIVAAIFAEECALQLGKDVVIENRAEHWALELQSYRQHGLLDVALFYLHTRRYAAFGLLYAHYTNTLQPHLLALLSTLPATESPAQYLRPIRFFQTEGNHLEPRKTELTGSLNEQAVRRLYERLPGDFRWKNTPPQQLQLADWTCHRIHELDTSSGLASVACELLEVTTELIEKSSSAEERGKAARDRRRALFMLRRLAKELQQFTTVCCFVLLFPYFAEKVVFSFTCDARRIIFRSDIDVLWDSWRGLTVELRHVAGWVAGLG